MEFIEKFLDGVSLVQVTEIVNNVEVISFKFDTTTYDFEDNCLVLCDDIDDFIKIPFDCVEFDGLECFYSKCNGITYMVSVLEKDSE